MSVLVQRQLFGGAITADATPNLIDASDVRQVPDTQEVFMYPDSSISIVVEILQRAEPSHYDDAIRFHFDSLAHDNDAQSAEIDAVSQVPNERGDGTPSATILSGVQSVKKFNRAIPDKVRIFMALYRVDSKRIDVVVTFNVPTKAIDGGAVNAEGLQKANADFDEFVRSFRIVDFGLFA
ncbi:hypothetical protein BDQ12DRAFT_758590 [Crucibulum laeve]|uniref:Mog1p/PsbP-like protein n=1 Tax=Crucibulum laeve TaxID=68775 RepID=A0A5C3MBR9_9AGAR|nr:hypothetical protein BDQ12DRAFT_758590 [Crucibulum laeve]